MFHKVSVCLILLAIIATLALLLYLSWPWGENVVRLEASDYFGLLSLALWAISPYLPLLARASKNQPSRAGNVVMLAGVAVIIGAGLGLYLDIIWRHPAPLSALAFLAVPVYQWVAALALMLVTSRWVQSILGKYS